MVCGVFLCPEATGMKLQPSDSKSGSYRRRGMPGFSMVEMLVVSAILIILAATASVAYTNYMLQVNTDLSGHQRDDLDEQIDVAVTLIHSGANSGLVDPGSGGAVTNESTCSEFLDSLKARTAHLRNPFDGSPAVTFSTAYDIHQKRGKIRITCYRMHNDTAANGGSCSLRNAGIRITHFKYNCGGKCGASTCTFPDSDCGDGPVVDGWTHGAQIDKFYGTVEARFLTHDNGTVKLHPWGDPMVDTAYANSACPGYGTYSRPKEADY